MKTSRSNISDDGAKLHFRRGRRLPVIRQSEAAECGLACLGMIASYYGHQVALPALRRKFSLSLKGVTLARLIEMAQSLGLSSRALRLDLNEVRQLQTPCILHWGMDHFVVLREVNSSHVVIHDPAVGERKVAWIEVDKHFTGVALELSPGPKFQRRRPDPPLSLRSLAGSIEGLGRSLIQIFGLALVLELFALISPQFMQMVVDRVLADGDRDLLTFLGVSFLLLLVLQVLVTGLRTWVVTWLGTHFNMGWTGNVFQHLLRLPQEYFLKRHLGDIVSRFGAIASIQQTLTTQFVSIILDGLMAALTLVMLYVYSPLLASIIVASVVSYGLLRLLYFHVYREANLNQIMVNARQQSSFMESVRGIQTLRLYNQGPMQTSRYLNVTAEALNTAVSIQRLNLVFGSMNSLVNGAQRIAVLWLGAWLALGNNFSAGMLMAFASYADQFSSRSSSLIDYGIQLRLLRLQGERIADIVLANPEAYADGSHVGPAPLPSITFENVGYRYAEGEPWVIKDCSFEIRPGEMVAIVGPSGCGKSTLIRLMLGLLDPQLGCIRIGDIDLKHLGKANYRSMAASVMQDDRLFSGSIADNICFFDEDAKPEMIEEAARLAQVHGDIVSMPMGYHSLVGDMGSTLSGGQQQRVHLARAFYRRPKILVLDEATSHLDVTRERAVHASMKSMHMTIVMVAHRPEAAGNADRILMLTPHGIQEISLQRMAS